MIIYIRTEENRIVNFKIIKTLSNPTKLSSSGKADNIRLIHKFSDKSMAVANSGNP
jgi:hypothetical protein